MGGRVGKKTICKGGRKERRGTMGEWRRGQPGKITF